MVLGFRAPGQILEPHVIVSKCLLFSAFSLAENKVLSSLVLGRNGGLVYTVLLKHLDAVHLSPFNIGHFKAIWR